MKNENTLRILYVSDLRTGYPMRQRYDALRDIASVVEGIDYSITLRASRLAQYWKKASYWFFRHGVGCFHFLDCSETNIRILEAIERCKWDILWLDRALVVERKTLERVKQIQPDCIILGFSHDDMAKRHNQSKEFLEHLPLYDVFYTTKSYNVEELKNMGCRRCKFINNGFDPKTHHPCCNKDGIRYPVGFVGYWEKSREVLFRILSESGIRIHVWGGGWHKCSFRHPNFIRHAGEVIGDAYAGTLSAMDISLCLLRRANRDLQTTRSIEIPACGVFMLGERTEEHQSLFKEGEEAEFFDTDDEMIAKIRFYLDNPDRRKQVALSGLNRCLKSGYSNHDHIKDILKDLGVISLDSTH